MFKQRLMTALIMFPVTVAIILFTPSDIFSWLVMLLMLLGGWEWLGLTGISRPLLRVGLLVVLAALMMFVSQLESLWHHALMLFSVLFWFLLLNLLPFYTQTETAEYRWQIMLRLLMYLLLPAAFISYSVLHNVVGAEYVLYVMLIAVTADTGAYFAGKRYGKRKLAPEISPGKTREGMLGGLAGVAVLSVLATFYFKLDIMAAVYVMLLSLLVAIISVVGDLFISLIKRESGSKDSGNLLPGHGGILDRIDSHIATAPFFTLGMLWWQGAL